MFATAVRQRQSLRPWSYEGDSSDSLAVVYTPEEVFPPPLGN
jgi:hypothetical protein